MSRHTRILALFAASWLFAGTALQAQEVVIDRQVRAGELTLFPSARNPNEYYYVADKARLATSESGRPQFSFLRYVEPEVTAEADTDKAAGGGIVHALVELGVPDEVLDDARSELRRVNPNGRVIGPVAFKSGTFALISSFATPDSEFTDQVLGVGKAPLLENAKAAVSLSLTRKGAEVLWESFLSGTPDISFSFNMDIDGFRSPMQAEIEADFERVYSHDNFSAGVATPYLQAEIEAAFEDLRRTGAIKVTQVGADEQMEALISTAYDRLTQLMFERADSSGTPTTAALAGGGGTDGMLDKASELLEARRGETRAANDAARERNARNAAARAKAEGTQARLEETQSRVEAAESGAAALDERAESARAVAEQYRARAEAATDATERGNYQQLAAHWTQQAERYERTAGERRTEADTRRQELGTHQSEAAEAESLAESAGEDEELEELPSLAIVASYKMKRVRQSGKFTIDLNKYTVSTLSHRFDQNIGDLSRFIEDDRVFRTVDIGNSAFRQREIPVFIDGLNVSDFGQYINFVTVTLRKRHENGTFSTDEVRIDRNNFQQTANNFKLAYAKLGDGNSDRFLEYEYRVLWNFFGGAEVDEAWRSSLRSGISVVPPYQPRSVFLEARPDDLAAANVRSVDVRLYYRLGDREQSKRISLSPRDGQDLSQTIDFMLPSDRYDYEYEIDWRLNDGTRVSSGRARSEDGTLYFDEIEEG